jgi:hypothetical protein
MSSPQLLDTTVIEDLGPVSGTAARLLQDFVGSGYELGGRGFESCRARQIIKDLAFNLCVTCIRTRDDPHFRFPTHLVHPEHGKHMTWDVRGEAVCPHCTTRWRSKRDNSVEILLS